MIITLFLVVWLLVLTGLLFKTLANYNRLTQGVTEQTLSEVLKTLLSDREISRSESKEIAEKLAEIEKTALRYTQKVGFVRFNPFSDTGGDQSFVLALLDGDLNGVVITSLYARTGMRWYIKNIKNGKGIEHELSKEEAEAIKKVSKK